MNVTLPPELATMVRGLMERGSFASEGDVVEAALRGMAAQEHRLAELRSMISEAEHGVARGEDILWSAELATEIWEQAQRAVAAGERPGPDVLR